MTSVLQNESHEPLRLTKSTAPHRSTEVSLQVIAGIGGPFLDPDGKL